MANGWRKAMTYLGLGPDEDYDDYEDVEPVAERAPRHDRPVRPRRPEPEYAEHDGVVSTVRRLEPQPVEPTPGIGAITSAGPKRSTPVVRAIPANATAKPHVMSPSSFNDAQEVADKFKVGVPVIINMQSVERDLARRLIDFASGLCYGLGGTMDKVAHQVYLLTPANVEVSPEERRRLQDRGLYD